MHDSVTATPHRTYVIRRYAMILEAVTSRIEPPLRGAYHHGVALAHASVARSCWVPKLLVAVVVARRSLRAPICLRGPSA